MVQADADAQLREYLETVDRIAGRAWNTGGRVVIDGVEVSDGPAGLRSAGIDGHVSLMVDGRVIHGLGSVESTLLRRGTWFESRVPSADELRRVRLAAGACLGVKGDPFPWKGCYLNAQRLAAIGGLEYWEGCAVGSSVPTRHAWNSIGGLLVDLTWSEHRHRSRDVASRVVGALPDGWAYCGVRFDADEVMDAWGRTGVADSLLDGRICADLQQAAVVHRSV